MIVDPGQDKVELVLSLVVTFLLLGQPVLVANSTKLVLLDFCLQVFAFEGLLDGLVTLEADFLDFFRLVATHYNLFN